METDEFNELFDEIVSPAFVSRGGHQAGRRLFIVTDTLTVALLRTETRHQPPPRYTLCFRHNGMRTMDEVVPTSPPTNPSDYMIKVAPSSATAILEQSWHYEPHNLGRFPGDEIDHSGRAKLVIRRLRTLRTQIDTVLPRLDTVLTPTRLAAQLQASGEDAWCERMWIEDLGGR
ncbi:MAG: hypothetical protein GY701_02625 [Sulfitobacter sp.]|nr:hypothetical protein [Sulfitobacter sp.]